VTHATGPPPHSIQLRSVKTAIALLALTAALLAPAAAQALPSTFFGIAPQTPLTEADTSYMRAARIGAVRWPINWATVQPTAKGGYDWSSVDPAVEAARKRGLQVLPFIYGTPSWIAPQQTTLPIDNARAMRAWLAFVRAAVQRYRPEGVHMWQVWNEANFFYFAYPASPSRYARLLEPTYTEIKKDDPSATVILSGLFGNPDQGGSKGMDATKFLSALYRVPGIKGYFDGVALHPYAFHVDDLEALTEEMREVVVENHDPSAALYITEMGWGSQNDPNVVAFEQGIQGQARELRKAYRFLIANRLRLNLQGTYWYSWKDNPEYTACNFCDSVGLFRAGSGFKPKPAWKAFVALTGGRARP
jgi:aryl-phospho-beta-D-glucosidase BglC (GH1 family)